MGIVVCWEDMNNTIDEDRIARKVTELILWWVACTIGSLLLSLWVQRTFGWLGMAVLVGGVFTYMFWSHARDARRADEEEALL